MILLQIAFACIMLTSVEDTIILVGTVGLCWPAQCVLETP